MAENMKVTLDPLPIKRVEAVEDNGTEHFAPEVCISSPDTNFILGKSNGRFPFNHSQRPTSSSGPMGNTTSSMACEKCGEFFCMWGSGDLDMVGVAMIWLTSNDGECRVTTLDYRC
eukprot:Gb_39723 [translate_table: standard]